MKRIQTSHHSDQNKWHETPADRKRQFEILFAFCSALHLSAIQTTNGNPYDAVIVRHPDPEALAYAEIKYRNHPFGRYPDYTIDVAKLEAIWEETEIGGVKALLIVSWQGDIRYSVLHRHEVYLVSKQLRRDRDELADDVYHIPLSAFKSLNEKQEILYGN